MALYLHSPQPPVCLYGLKKERFYFSFNQYNFLSAIMTIFTRIKLAQDNVRSVEYIVMMMGLTIGTNL